MATALFTTRSEDKVASDAADFGLRMSEHQSSVVHGVLAGTESGEAVVSDFSASVADRVLAVVNDSFVAGVQFSFRVVAAIALIGLVIAIVGVRPHAEDEDEEAAADAAPQEA